MEPAVGLSVAVVYSAVVLVMLPLLPGCATGCEYQLLRPSARNDGYIASPDYPQHYSPGFCLMWVYYGRSGVRISMRLLDIDIPSFSDTCTNDFLMVGPINEDIYCGSIDRRSFQEYDAVMTASQNWLFVVFNSTNLGVKGRGFKIYYQLSTATPSSTTSVSTTTQPSYQWSDSRIDISSCQFVFPTEAGEITTNKTVFDCLKQRGKATWLVYHPGSDDTGVSYELIFQRCYLPYPDTVKVYDGYARTANVLSYIRRTCPSYLVTSHHGFLLEYVRRSTREFPNFRIKFVVVRAPQTSTPMSTTGVSLAGNPIQNYPDKCIFHLSDPTGEIRSDNLMHAVRNTGYCSWHLHFYTSNVRQIIYTLDFEKLQLSSSSIFRIHDGSDRTAAVLGPPFPTRRPFTLISSINSIYIYYVPGVSSDLVTAKDAFNIKFSTVVKCPPGYEACGYRELACFKTENRCDGVWHCPLHGEDERGCTAECPADFSCDFRTSNCYSENDRCNGKGACPNYMDETGCNRELCSAAKGLFLCRNGRCIYEKWRCDRMNDCFDNSDEEECSFTSSPQVVVAAAIGSLICGLLLVVTVGCVCKVYQMRAHHLRGIPSQETPLSRQLAEMFHQRAPPPPYHEAMLTSRPYSEAYLELLNQTENQVESSEASSHDDFSASLTSPDDRSQRSRQSLHQGLSEDQLPSSQFRTESLVGGDSMPLFLEVFEGDVLHQHSLGITESLPFSEADPSMRALLYCSSSDDESGKNEDRCSDNAGFAGGDEAFVGFDGSPQAHSEAVPSSTTVRSDLTPASPGLHLGDCNGTGSCQSEDPKEKEGIRDNGIGIVNAAVSVDSLNAAAEEDCNNLQKSTSCAFDDSDCDCILAENAAEDLSNEDTDSDTVCILGRV